MKYLDRRVVQTSSGDYFSCFYTINYNSRGVVSTKKSSVICDPDTEGGHAIQVFDLPKVGPTSIKHNVKAGKDTVKEAKVYTGTSSNLQPMNCSCKASFPYELMEVLEAMKPEEMVVAGRGGAVSRGHGGGGGGRPVGALLAPLLIILLLPTFLSSLQTLLAGRALEVSDLKQDLLDGLTDRLNSGHTGGYFVSRSD